MYEKISNFILGLSFITEGAIPFAAKEPVKVIGSCIVGAVISGVIFGVLRGKKKIRKTY